MQPLLLNHSLDAVINVAVRVKDATKKMRRNKIVTITILQATEVRVPWRQATTETINEGSGDINTNENKKRTV